MSEEILPCPYCGAVCALFDGGPVGLGGVECDCEYSSPNMSDAEDAITVHNDLCRLVQRGRELRWRGPEERPGDGQEILVEAAWLKTDIPEKWSATYIGGAVTYPDGKEGEWDFVRRWMPWPVGE